MKYNREGLLDEAYKFFTYLDTSTTKGYDVSELTSSNNSEELTAKNLDC